MKSRGFFGRDQLAEWEAKQPGRKVVRVVNGVRRVIRVIDGGLK